MTLSLLTNSKNWTEPAVLPKVGDRHWNGVNVVGLVFLVMAVLQAIGFHDFSNWLTSARIGDGNGSLWAVIIIIAELWAGLSMMRVRMPSAFRLVGSTLAIIASGFWLVVNFQQVTGSAGTALTNSGYFGKYLVQAPGWWTVIEATVFLLCSLWAVDLLKNKK